MSNPNGFDAHQSRQEMEASISLLTKKLQIIQNKAIDKKDNEVYLLCNACRWLANTVHALHDALLIIHSENKKLSELKDMIDEDLAEGDWWKHGEEPPV